MTNNRPSARVASALNSPRAHVEQYELCLRPNQARDGSVGSRQWVFAFDAGGKRREICLGSYPQIDLSEALARHDLASAEIASRRERDPNCRTFGDVALAVVASIGPGFRNEKHREQWSTSLERHAKSIWYKPVSEVDTDAVRGCLEPIWGKIPETAARLRGRIERVLDAARVEGLRPPGENPARWKGHLALIMPTRNLVSRGHFTAMPYEMVPGFMTGLRAREGLGARMLEVTVLTAVRSGDSIGARRTEIDLASQLWTIPATRTKAGREHRVPLVGRALELIRQACGDKSADDYLFHGPRRDGRFSNMVMSSVLARMKLDVTVHGFRSSFCDWAGDQTDFPDEIIEQALAHTVGSEVRRAYRRRDALKKRHDLMTAWDAFCDSAS